MQEFFFPSQFVKNTYLTVGSIALACGSCALPGCFWFQAMFFNSVFLEIVGGVLVSRSPEQLRKRMMQLAGACFQAMFFNSVSKETFDWYLLVGFYCLEQQYTARTTFSQRSKYFRQTVWLSRVGHIFGFPQEDLGDLWKSGEFWLQKLQEMHIRQHHRARVGCFKRIWFLICWA